MSKKKLYGMLTFTIATFALLAVVIFMEFSQNNSFASENSEEETVPAIEEIAQDTIEETLEEETVTTETETANAGDSQDETSEEDTKDISEETVMVFAGDVYLSDYVLNKYNKKDIDGILSKDLQAEFQNSDIAMVNEEFPFSKRGTAMKDKQYTFRIDPKWVQILLDMNVDIVTLANNHSLDFGEKALLDTFDTLTAAGISYVGAGHTIEEAKETKNFETNGKTIAILGASRVIPVPEWNAGTNKAGLFTTYDPAALVTEIKKAEDQSDFVVVYVHWGIERDTKPKDYQRNLAKQYIDAGADLVIGSHPHVLQGIEYYKDVPIVYSLGNFMFYNSIEQTALLKAVVNENNELKLQLIPCKASDARTFIVDNTKAKEKFYDYITKISYDISFDENGFIQ